ncbi:tripartite tricarboxylate transporter TctB family protein [Hominifimenecus sp. rT4P-3]|uniref:tripartite tricarboxylate transporter TctB family protein n=1 Tax=Hominifimenecus sp. rT4P-3 TaxID=3242979 RepID=UPI003DA2C743
MSKRERDTFAFREYLVIVLFMILTGVLIKEAISIYSKVPKINGPGTLPLILLGIMTICILITLIMARREIPEDREKYTNKGKLVIDSIREGFPLDVTGFLVITVGYLLILGKVNYIIATTLFMVAQMLFLIRKKLSVKMGIKRAIIAVVTTLACYLIFAKVFLVTLP